MRISRFPHPQFTSNTYLIRDGFSSAGWLIDAGQAEEIAEMQDMDLRAIFLTHAHYDHIFGLNRLVRLFPNCRVYASSHTQESLYSPKMNLSFYHEIPIVYDGPQVTVLKEGDRVPLNEENHIRVMETPGHNEGCLTFQLGDILFTGDSWIPGIKVVTKLKGGNREANQLTLKRIEKHVAEGNHIYPGHGETFSNEELAKFMPLL